MKIFRLLKKIDVRDILFVGGFALMGYGLFLFLPWVSFTVCGVLLIAMGVSMKRVE